MAADLTKPFDPSCCDGGVCDISGMSAQSCGCDAGLKPTPWVCERHKMEALLMKGLKTNSDHIDDFLEEQLFKGEENGQIETTPQRSYQSGVELCEAAQVEAGPSDERPDWARFRGW